MTNADVLNKLHEVAEKMRKKKYNKRNIVLNRPRTSSVNPIPTEEKLHCSLLHCMKNINGHCVHRECQIK